MVVARDGDVLLHRRRDVPVWDLPGGRLEPGELREQAAAREALEETGYDVAVRRLVGEYWRPQDPGGGTLVHVLAAEVRGGAPIRRGPETLAVRWFPVDRLPFTLFRLSREYIRDAAAGLSTPVVRTQRMPGWLALALWAALRLRR